MENTIMKKYSILILCGICLTIGFTSCEDESVSGPSIFSNDTIPDSGKFDLWIEKNFIDTYNVEVIYRFKDIDVDQKLNLAPADLEKAEAIAYVAKYCWYEAYDAVAGKDFTRQYAPRQLQLIGSWSYDYYGHASAGTAEGGMKVNLFGVNYFSLRPGSLAQYFSLMHHEFAHILHQKKEYDPEFKKISSGDYVGGMYIYYSDRQQALDLGFITTYARSNFEEDITELTSVYVTSSKDEWDELINRASPSGQDKLKKKLNIMRTYMKESWNIDIDSLRSEVQRRMEVATSGQLPIQEYLDSLK